jgi:hypothetical protein
MFEQEPYPDPEPTGNPTWLAPTLRESLELILEQPPSADTWQGLQLFGPHVTDPVDRVLLAVAWDRQVNAASAEMYAAVADATTRRPGDKQTDLETEVALALRRSPEGGRSLTAFAKRLVGQLPVMHGLLTTGQATVSHARVIEDLTFGLTDEQVADVDARVSPRAATLTLPSFRRAVRIAVAAVDPDNAEKRRQRAKKEQTGVKVTPRPDGMGALTVTAPLPDCVKAAELINERADRLRVPDDERTHGERQVEGLLDALEGTPVQGEGRVMRRRNAQLVAFIDMQSLVGLRNSPGELAGYGPVPAQTIRDMLADEGTVLHRLVHDPISGVVTDYCVKGYEPDDVLRAVTQARDVTCRFPGCTRNAVWCDNEHATPYDEGGETSCANCGLMCRGHHNLKTHEGFGYSRTDFATGETLWQTPLGFIYKQGAAFYYQDGRDAGDTTLLKRPP